MSTIKNKINKIEKKIRNNEYGESSAKINVGNGWQLIKDDRIIEASCTYKKTLYADFSVWGSQYKYSSNVGNYYAFVYQNYIKPNPHKTDYRSDKLVCKFAPNNNALLRDYKPTVKNPSETISYGSNVVVSTSGDVELGIDVSYTTLKESPLIVNNSNMTKDYSEIVFDYLNPSDNKGKYYIYNTSETVQVTSYVIKENENNKEDIICNNDRILNIQRDSIFTNHEASFNLEYNDIVKIK